MEAAISPGVTPRANVIALPSGNVTVTLEGAETGADTGFLLVKQGAEHPEPLIQCQGKLRYNPFADSAKREKMRKSVLGPRMTRLAILGSVSLVVLGCVVLPACGQQDEARALLAQCNDPLPRDLDSCVARVHAMDETNPSPELQSLMARLIVRQARISEPPPDQGYDPDHPPDDEGVSSYDVAPPDPPPSTDLGPLQPYAPPPYATSQDEAPPDTQGDPSDAGPPPDANVPAGDANAPYLPQNPVPHP